MQSHLPYPNAFEILLSLCYIFFFCLINNFSYFCFKLQWLWWCMPFHFPSNKKKKKKKSSDSEINFLIKAFLQTANLQKTGTKIFTSHFISITTESYLLNLLRQTRYVTDQVSLSGLSQVIHIWLSINNCIIQQTRLRPKHLGLPINNYIIKAQKLQFE